MTKTPIKYLEYKINSHNSTVCGYPGRNYDWSKFDWNQQTVHNDKLAEMFSRNKINVEAKAPAVFVDDFMIGKGNQYLHVPYDWPEHGTIYRVRPNESMQA